MLLVHVAAFVERVKKKETKTIKKIMTLFIRNKNMILIIIQHRKKALWFGKENSKSFCLDF